MNFLQKNQFKQNDTYQTFSKLSDANSFQISHVGHLTVAFIVLNYKFFKTGLCLDLCQIQLRAYLSYINQLQMVYWGISDLKAQSLSSGPQSTHFQDATVDGQQPIKASTLAKNWVRSMFGRESVLKVNSFNHARGWTIETKAAGIFSLTVISCFLTSYH